MARKQIAALAALICAATPAAAFDLGQPNPGMKFYISVPLDGRTPKEQQLGFGMQMQGGRDWQVVNIDSRTFNFLPLGGLEAKFIIAGVVAAGAAVAVSKKDKSRNESYQAQQAVQAAQKPDDCAQPQPVCPTP